MHEKNAKKSENETTSQGFARGKTTKIVGLASIFFFKFFDLFVSSFVPSHLQNGFFLLLLRKKV